MSERVREQAEKLEQQKDVREARDQTAGRPSPEMPKAATSDKLWFGSYVILLVGLGVLYYLFSLRFFGLPGSMVDFVLRYTRGAILIVLVLTLAKAVAFYWIGRVHTSVTRFNPGSLLRLLL